MNADTFKTHTHAHTYSSSGGSEGLDPGITLTTFIYELSIKYGCLRAYSGLVNKWDLKHVLMTVKAPDLHSPQFAD